MARHKKETKAARKKRENRDPKTGFLSQHPQDRGNLAQFGRIGPAWMRRALDPSTPTLRGETVNTASLPVGGRELLFPMVRMGEDGKLFKFKSRADALGVAVQNNDFIAFTDGPEADRFSRELSDTISVARKKKRKR